VKHTLVAGLSGTHAREIEPDIAVLENGFIAVSWTQGPHAADHLDAYVRIFDETGTALPGAAARYSLGSVDDDHPYFRQADIAATLGGRLVATWRDTDVDGSGDGVSTVVKNLVRRSVGTEGSDSFLGDELDDEVHAGGGADLVAGAGGRDQLYGEAGNDFLSGNEGGDYLYGGDGADIANGGADNDFISGETGADTLAGGDGEDRVYGGEDADRLSGGAGDDTLSGETGADALNGGDGRDQMFGGAGLDRLEGGTGDDSYFLTDITPTDAGNAGSAPPPGPGEPPSYVFDTVVEAGGAGFDSVYVQRATYGQATLASYTLGDNIERGVIQGTAAFDLTGNALANKLYGNAAANTLKGLGSDDFLFAGGGDDRLEGGAGNDSLFGQAGADTMIGGAGGDTYEVDNAKDVITEAANGGVDRVNAVVSHVLGANVENLLLIGPTAHIGVGNDIGNAVRGTSGANRLSGLGGSDELYGYDGADVLTGGADADWLDGGAGQDEIFGGEGADRLIGRGGADRLTGQTGADLFLFNQASDSTYSAGGRDTILDFSRAQGDKIGLSDFDANLLAAGAQHFNFIGAAEFTAIGQLRYKAFDGYSLLYGEVTGDKIADFALRLDNVTSLAASDFDFAA
jgi:Ca2+-binding RTX toxin-like protein